MNIEPEYYTPDELAEYLKVSVKFIRKNSFRIPGRLKVGKLVRYQKSAVLRAAATGTLLLRQRTRD